MSPIFLNLIRASHDYPLSFATIGTVSPQITNTTSLALPSFLFGPHIGSYATAPAAAAPLFTPGRDVIFGNTTAGNTTAVQTLFQVTTLETGAFYQGFLRPIDLQTLNYFIRQGYPRELLFWLFTDSFELTLPTGHYGYHYSPPNDYGCSQTDPKHRCFVDWVHNAAFSGLTVEEMSPSSGDAKQKTTYARFCFNEVLGQQAAALVPREKVTTSLHDLDVQTTLIYNSDYVCGSDAWNPMKNAAQAQADILPLTLGPISFKIIPRSAYGVFEFLGTIIKMQQQHLGPAPYAYIPAYRRYAERLYVARDRSGRSHSNRRAAQNRRRLLRPYLVRRQRLLRSRPSGNHQAPVRPVGAAHRDTDPGGRPFDPTGLPRHAIGHGASFEKADFRAVIRYPPCSLLASKAGGRVRIERE